MTFVSVQKKPLSLAVSQVWVRCRFAPESGTTPPQQRIHKWVRKEIHAVVNSFRKTVNEVRELSTFPVHQLTIVLGKNRQPKSGKDTILLQRYSVTVRLSLFPILKVVFQETLFRNVVLYWCKVQALCVKLSSIILSISNLNFSISHLVLSCSSNLNLIFFTILCWLSFEMSGIGNSCI